MTVGLLNPSRFGVVFNPLTQVTPLHAVWADDPLWSNPGNNGSVASWRNTSGGGDPAQISAVNQPKWFASISQLNNRAAVEFDATGGTGLEDLLAVDIADIAQPFKVITAFRLTSTPAAQAGIVGFGAGATHGFSYVTTPNWRISTGVNLSGGTPNTNGHVARMTLNSASSQLWIDGTSVAGPANASTNSLTRWKLASLGSGATNATFGSVQIAFCAVYAGSTLDTDLTTLETALRTYYGTA